MAERKTFTGRERRRRTSKSVRAADIVARGLITIGGVGTIVAVSMVGLFLVWKVLPLFTSAVVDAPVTIAAAWGNEQKPLHLEVDDSQAIGWSMARNGIVTVFQAATGEKIEQQQPLEDAELTAWKFTFDREQVAFGFADGTVRIGSIGFATRFLEPDEVAQEVRDLDIGGVLPYENGMIQRSPQGQFRLLTVESKFGPPLEVGESPIRRLDFVDAPTGPLLATWSDAGKLQFHTIAARVNVLLGEETMALDESMALPVDDAPAGPPDWLLISGRGDALYAAWKAGDLLRYDARTAGAVTLAERLSLVPDGSTSLTSLELLLGRSTLISGDSRGRVVSWFQTRSSSPPAGRAKSSDGAYLTRIHELAEGDSAVTSLAMSARTRMAAAGDASGAIRVFHVTTDQLILETSIGSSEPVDALFMAPNDDGLYAAADSGLWHARFDPQHPEVTLSSLFRPVWYEEYPEPSHAWQSTGASVDVEAKLGMMPLVFGTLKATLYSMLFGMPLALLAAIYTSEFLNPRLRSTIKPTIEMMASLPSVVLGFLAALVFAVWVERYLATVLASFVVVPFTVVFLSYLWQMLPHGTGLRLSRFRFLFILLLGIPAGCGLSWVIGPVLERVLFAGDLVRWLDGTATSKTFGAGVGGWFILLLPLSGVTAALLSSRFVTPALVRRTRGGSRSQFVALDFLKFLGMTAGAILIAWLTSWMLTAIGFDPRGSFLDTYVQRNALVVGFVMGFAVIPIIYTIADDALSAVPEQLRSASLGAGATPWQTAVRIVIPTAMSGLFSAMMVGLGRAVGETMIVLMAAGNTPVMNWNPFEGFRTLSANIAVELPEAVRDGTHYRTLFLAALTLFLFTFAVNTVAEMVRLRFRRRVYQL